MRANIQALLLLLALLYAQPARASDLVSQHIAGGKPVGEARLTVLFWDVYDATLYAPAGRWSPDEPFALSLHYLRDLNGRDIADRSVQEMRKQGFDDEVMLAAWHAQMKAIFPNVSEGTVLTAIFIPGKHTAFYEGNKPIGTIKSDAFIAWFSDIWLGEKTSEPALRRKLLGAS